MFEDKVSVFENFHSEPKTITLGQWLKVCKHGSRYAKQVLEYRNTKADSLKKSLPLVTVGAVCSNGRKLENVVNRTGWIALDIDGKDNRHLPDAEHIRDEVAKIKNVAFAGLSAGGTGVWVLVKVANPERQADYFDMLFKDFKIFGITLDSSKGRNPNDARFYSYDPGAIIKDSFTVYTKLPNKQNLRKPKIKDFANITKGAGNNIPVNYSRYAETAFTNELEILSQATKGSRNETLFKNSASLAGLVAGGMLDEYDVRQSLRQTALSVGLKQREINATINSGFKAGFKNPRTPDSISRNSVKVNYAPRRDSAGNGEYESRILAPNGFNPYTGEIFDKRGYPALWGEIEAPAPGTPEYIEAEYYRAMDADPMLEEIHN